MRKRHRIRDNPCRRINKVKNCGERTSREWEDEKKVDRSIFTASVSFLGFFIKLHTSSTQVI